jgi:hypothetical protein
MHTESLEKFHAIIMPGIEKLILTSQSDSINVFGKMFDSETIQNTVPAEFFVEILNMTTELSEDMKNTFEGMKNTNVGAVTEGDSLIHVITRTDMNIGGQVIKELNVNTLKRDEGDWKLLLSNKFEGVAMMIRRGLPQ